MAVVEDDSDVHLFREAIAQQDWYQHYQNSTVDDWTTVLFTEEFRFGFDSNSRRVYLCLLLIWTIFTMRFDSGGF